MNVRMYVCMCVCMNIMHIPSVSYVCILICNALTQSVTYESTYPTVVVRLTQKHHTLANDQLDSHPSTGISFPQLEHFPQAEVATAQFSRWDPLCKSQTMKRHNIPGLNTTNRVFVQEVPVSWCWKLHKIAVLAHVAYHLREISSNKSLG